MRLAGARVEGTHSKYFTLAGSFNDFYGTDWNNYFIVEMHSYCVAIFVCYLKVQAVRLEGARVYVYFPTVVLKSFARVLAKGH